MQGRGKCQGAEIVAISSFADEAFFGGICPFIGYEETAISITN
jgi:hypothetical protein